MNELERRTAELLGKQAAVFMPSGSMSNQVAVRVHTEPGDSVLIDARAHLILNEGGAAAAVGGVTMTPVAGVGGVFTAEQVDAAIEPSHRFNPSTLGPPPRLLCVENTHNAGGGTVWPLDGIHEVCAVARRHGLALHMDGARLWHASAASGVSERDFAEPFDTVSVCYSKGLGAPVGSVLAGGSDMVARARRFKQQLGGGLRQSGVLAAAALHALECHRDGLVKDVQNARALAEGLAAIDGIDIDPARVQSNIVRFRLTRMDAGAFADRCHERGVHVLPGGRHGVRAVAHRDVDKGDVKRALGVIAAVLAAGEAGAATSSGASP